MHHHSRKLANSLIVVALSAGIAACEQSPQPVEPSSAAFAKSTGTGSLNQALAELRQVTARYHDIEQAWADGYERVPLTDCWAHGSSGAMGYHFQNPTYVNDGQVRLLEPELLMYEPQPGGHMRLVGMEYIVFTSQWQGSENPMLLGERLEEHPDLPLYKLHIWLWRNNSAGIFADWNAKVSCDHAESTTFFE